MLFILLLYSGVALVTGYIALLEPHWHRRSVSLQPRTSKFSTSQSAPRQGVNNIVVVAWYAALSPPQIDNCLYKCWYHTTIMSRFNVLVCEHSSVKMNTHNHHIYIQVIVDLVLSALSAWVLNICKAKMFHSWFKIKSACTKCNRRPYPSLCLHRYHSRDKLDQAFSLCFCMLQAIKNWMVWRPEN